MTCIHGLDDINCPICRISTFSVPKDSVRINNFHQNELKPYFHESRLKEDIINEIVPGISDHKLFVENKSINPLPAAKLPNELPNFKNRMFQERLDELNMNKSDNLKLSKKASLEDPKWKFEE